MVGATANRLRDPRSDNLEDRYRGFVSLPKMLLEPDEARNRESERIATEQARSAEALNRQGGVMAASPSARIAQLAIPIPRFFPLLPPLFYNGGHRGSPPRGPGPQNPRKPRKECEAEWEQNRAACEAAYPRVSFPGHDFFKTARGSCYRDAAEAYYNCETGREGKPFNPRLYYEEDD